MAKNSIVDYSSTAGNNTDIQSVNIAEGCAPSGINNAIRELMADAADLVQGTVTATSIKATTLWGGNFTATTATMTTASVVTGTITTLTSTTATVTSLTLSNALALASGGTGGTSTATARTSLGAAADASTQTIWVPATAMIARTTNGAASGTAETTTNKVMRRTFDFDASTIEYAQFAIRMPKGWDEGTVTAAFTWSHPSTTTNFNAIWALQGVALSNDDALDTAFGTAQTVTDTGGTTDDIYVTATTSAITIAGSPAAEDYVVFQVYRDASNGSDTLAVDARLHGVTLYYTTTSLNDA